MGSMRKASATAAPPLDPPAERAESKALPVAPKTSLKLCEPSPNSGVLVLPMMIAPAARMRAVAIPSSSGTKSRKIGEPNVVVSPLVGDRSLIATGNP